MGACSSSPRGASRTATRSTRRGASPRLSGPEDSPSYHLADTLAAGAGLCNEDAARILAEQGPQAISELVRLGVIFDTADGEVSLGREAAHRMPRVLHAGGDATGARIELTLSSLTHHSRISVQEYVTTTRLLLDADGGRVVGVAGLVGGVGAEVEFYAAHTVLATGGAGRLYRYTTNPEVTTGDGVAQAYEAGAAVMDMEFYQFHPTALRLPGAPPFLITEAMRGEGAVLRNVHGDVFMTGFHPQGDLAPRDVVSRSLLEEMRRTEAGHVVLDATHLPAEMVAARFPSIYNTCLTHGLDITKDPIPGVASGTLHDGGRAHQHGGGDDASWPLRVRRGRLHGPARRKPAGEQLAVGDGGLWAASSASHAGGRVDRTSARGGVRTAGGALSRRVSRRWKGCRR